MARFSTDSFTLSYVNGYIFLEWIMAVFSVAGSLVGYSLLIAIEGEKRWMNSLPSSICAIVNAHVRLAFELGTPFPFSEALHVTLM